MADINVTINGIQGTVPAGSTILNAARQLGVDIPTLCDHPAIKPIGACRICLVEIEKVRGLQPACTFPASEGMVIQTESKAVVDARRFVLQLLFSERNHYCMFCQMSGSCELQNLAYRYKLDHWIYNRPFPKLPVDASRHFFVMDHNRCILCRRCVRVCDEQVANNTLGLKYRGASTMIIADGDVPFGESSCIACGTCLQVCPTGALADRISAYGGATKEVTRVKSRCTACSIGCGVELVVHDDHVIRVEGDWSAEPNHGLLCEMGRFTPLYEKRQRTHEPSVKQGDKLVAAKWDEALKLVAERMQAHKAKMCTVFTGCVTNEAAEAVVKGFPGDKAVMEGATSRVSQASLAALDSADVVIVAQADVARTHPVAAMAIRRAVRHHGARLMVVDQESTGLDDWAIMKGAPSQVGKAIEVAQGAQSPVILTSPSRARRGATTRHGLAQGAGRLPCPCGQRRRLGRQGRAATLERRWRQGLLCARRRDGPSITPVAAGAAKGGLCGSADELRRAVERVGRCHLADADQPRKERHHDQHRGTRCHAHRCHHQRATVRGRGDPAHRRNALIETRRDQMKVTLCTDWLDACAGCHMSLLDIDERIVELVKHVQILSTPITDLKHPPKEGCDVGILTGAVSSDHQVEAAQLMRSRAKILIAMGDCAVFGGICTMRNFFQTEDVLRRGYVETESTAPNQQIPRSGEIAKLLPQVLAVNQVVKVDVYLPGCPPPADAIWYTITELLAGRIPVLPDKLFTYD